MRIAKAIEVDGTSIAPYLREVDTRECLALTGETPEQCLPEAIKTSTKSWSAFDDEHDYPVAVGGVVTSPYDSDAGIPWFMSTPHPPWRFYMRTVPEMVASYQGDYKMLYNLIDMRNTVSIQWLARIGFRFGEVHPRFGHARIPFIEFCKVTV